MRLNTISSKKGSITRKKRVGRGIGSGLGKTCGRGHKGQKSRSGKKISRTFEGGQTPLYRRSPKFGFFSRKKKLTVEVRLSDLNKINTQHAITINELKKNNIINHNIKYVKIILNGNLKKSIVVEGLSVTKGARLAIESCGGKIKNA